MRSEVFDRSKELFSLDTAVKEGVGVHVGGFTRGYIGMGGESGSSMLERKEGYSYGFNWPEKAPPDIKCRVQIGGHPQAY